jgi:hypothetical protein
MTYRHAPQMTQAIGDTTGRTQRLEGLATLPMVG